MSVDRERREIGSLTGSIIARKPVLVLNAGLAAPY